MKGHDDAGPFPGKSLKGMHDPFFFNRIKFCRWLVKQVSLPTRKKRAGQKDALPLSTG